MEPVGNEAENTSTVVGRIQAMFAHYGLNASSASKLLGYSSTSKLYKILQGSEPSLPTLVEFLDKWPDVSIEWLVQGRGPMLRSGAGETMLPAPAGRVLTADRLPAINSGQVITITVDKDGEDNTELVPVAAQAGYAVQHNEAVFVSDLPRYRIPGFESGKFRAFEVSGDSMEPTLNHRDIVVCSLVDNWRLLIPGDVYVVVTDESVMLKRIHHRITDLAGTVELHSDNPHRRPYAMECVEITQLWRVRGYVSSYIPSAPDVTIERLWEVIEVLGFDKGEVRRHLAESAPNPAPIG